MDRCFAPKFTRYFATLGRAGHSRRWRYSPCSRYWFESGAAHDRVDGNLHSQPKSESGLSSSGESSRSILLYCRLSARQRGIKDPRRIDRNGCYSGKLRIEFTMRQTDVPLHDLESGDSGAPPSAANAPHSPLISTVQTDHGLPPIVTETSMRWRYFDTARPRSNSGDTITNSEPREALRHVNDV